MYLFVKFSLDKLFRNYNLYIKLLQQRPFHRLLRCFVNHYVIRIVSWTITLRNISMKLRQNLLMLHYEIVCEKWCFLKDFISIPIKNVHIFLPILFFIQPGRTCRTTMALQPLPNMCWLDPKGRSPRLR